MRVNYFASGDRFRTIDPDPLHPTTKLIKGSFTSWDLRYRRSKPGQWLVITIHHGNDIINAFFDAKNLAEIDYEVLM